MAIIKRLEISCLRNLEQVRLSPTEQINIIYGDNGSGKTSLLESIHMLGVGRSFRSNKLDSVIQNGADNCVVFAQLEEGVSIGLNKSRREAHTLKLQGNKQRNWTETARALPVQVINAESFALLEGGPRIRRRFLDWGVFHVEHDFINYWRDTAKCLAHRNLLLKQRSSVSPQMGAWNAELSAFAEKIDCARQAYFQQFQPIALETVKELIDIEGLSLRYWRGWSEDEALIDCLETELTKDLRLGSTQSGPHRADILVHIGRKPAAEILSRGQQKLLVSALKIAQGRLMALAHGRSSVYLVDDLPAELDRLNRERVCGLLLNLGNQIFLTSVSLDELENTYFSGTLPRKFHVEHGKISADE